MPQMKPLLWMFMFTFVLIYFTSMTSLMYFNSTNYPVSPIKRFQSSPYSIYYWTWKW